MPANLPLLEEGSGTFLNQIFFFLNTRMEGEERSICHVYAQFVLWVHNMYL